LTGETAAVPLKKLKLLQDSLQRTEHAMNDTLTSNVNAAQLLQCEKVILMNALNQISKVTGEEEFPRRHFKEAEAVDS